MTNLEQIRAKMALEAADSINKKAVNKLPALIINHGLLATAAFCQSESKGENRSDMALAMDKTTQYLSKINKISPDAKNIEDLLCQLSQKSSLHLQNATFEALEFIGYLRRLAVKSDSKK